MGLLRWAAIIGTGGLAPVKGTSPRERTAKAAEKQVRLQQQALSGPGKRATSSAPLVKPKTKFRVACAYCGQRVWLPIGHDVECPQCREVMDVRREGGIPGVRPIRAVRPDAAAPDTATIPVQQTRGAVTARAYDAAKTQALADGATEQQAATLGKEAAGRAYAQWVAPGAGTASELGHLADLHNQGALTDDEFAAAKAKILGS